MGGWNGTKSVIRRCLECDSVTQREHSRFLAAKWIQQIELRFKKGKIEVYGGFGAKPELIMAVESKLIKKGKLRHLLVSTGYQFE